MELSFHCTICRFALIQLLVDGGDDIQSWAVQEKSSLWNSRPRLMTHESWVGDSDNDDVMIFVDDTQQLDGGCS